MIPCAPEPVILIAGASSPSTLASIAALHNKLAVSTALSLIVLFPLFIYSDFAKVVRSLAMATS